MMRNGARVLLPLLCLLPAGAAPAADPRQPALLPPAAQETLRQEMLDKLLALTLLPRLTASCVGWHFSYRTR